MNYFKIRDEINEEKYSEIGFEKLPSPYNSIEYIYSYKRHGLNYPILSIRKDKNSEMGNRTYPYLIFSYVDSTISLNLQREVFYDMITLGWIEKAN